MYYPGNWIHSFPQNFQWSNATLVCKGMAPYGAVALGEIDWIVQKLHQRASNYYYTGERMVPPGEQKTAIYRKALRCFQEGLKRRYPNLEIADVAYEKSSLAAYFLKSPTAKGRAPTVVLFNGLDNCKE